MVSVTSSDSFDLLDPEKRRAYLAAMTKLPGVYRMFDAAEQILYVGKAKNLKKRVSSYFSNSKKSAKTVALIEKVVTIELTITSSETEALLLEQTLIKQLRPPFNILLRDDKSYPHIFLSDHDSPRLCFHRGGRREKGRYFGPFPSGLAVRESLNLLQKLFKVRQCDDSFFRNRSRPCLQYQIKRCSAPCVGAVSPDDYQRDVALTRLFLEGRNQQVIESLIEQMDLAAEALEYERAAELRDQVRMLRQIQETQVVEGEEAVNIDILGVVQGVEKAVVNVLFVRQGRVVDSKNYLIKCAMSDYVEGQVVSQFVSQYYVGSAVRDIPDVILLPEAIEDATLIAAWLTDSLNRRVTISAQKRGVRAAWLKMALLNAQTYLETLLTDHHKSTLRMEALQQALQLDESPQRVECFDISHTSGDNSVASCVVFDQAGPAKSDYRRFDMRDIKGGDDYAAMRQVLTRRYLRVKKGELPVPDIIVIDGGKGQLTVAHEVMQELQLDHPIVLGVAKGVTRRLGMETIYRKAFDTGELSLVNLDNFPQALNLIYQIRDEAHRFAITGHRAKVHKKMEKSGLEAIPGVGPKKRQQLLKQLGGLQGVMRANIADLSKVPGISQALAEAIYHYLHQ